jgi:hypothetical protein
MKLIELQSEVRPRVQNINRYMGRPLQGKMEYRFGGGRFNPAVPFL